MRTKIRWKTPYLAFIYRTRTSINIALFTHTNQQETRLTSNDRPSDRECEVSSSSSPYLYLWRAPSPPSLSLPRSLSPSSRLKLALVKFLLTTFVSYNVCSKIDLGRASLQSTNKEKGEEEEEKRGKEEKRLKQVTCSPLTLEMKRRLTK